MKYYVEINQRPNFEKFLEISKKFECYTTPKKSDNITTKVFRQFAARGVVYFDFETNLEPFEARAKICKDFEVGQSSVNIFKYEEVTNSYSWC
jgi:hypothetical protein